MPANGRPTIRNICFVTGTRAEFGLMRSTLQAIGAHPALRLQLIVTGMHLDASRGRSIDAIGKEGWEIDAVIPWKAGRRTQSDNAIATGNATAGLAAAFAKLKTDVVLVVGDRVEAFAAATAGHVSGLAVAHVHGGDRALGLVDDSLRHAITKLAHIHFPATRQSAQRIAKMGEDRRRIFRVGSPGLDGARSDAASRSELASAFKGLVPRRFALLLLHPQSTDPQRERHAANVVFNAVRLAGFDHIVIVHPNNDPGSDGIAAAWNALQQNDRIIIRRDIPRPQFLGLMRETAVLVGNSSSGIIEAASFGTPVVDIGNRQSGRERGKNVAHAAMNAAAVARALNRIWNNGCPLRFTSSNIYGAGGAGGRIAATLSRTDPRDFLSKLIAY